MPRRLRSALAGLALAAAPGPALAGDASVDLDQVGTGRTESLDEVDTGRTRSLDAVDPD